MFALFLWNLCIPGHVFCCQHNSTAEYFYFFSFISKFIYLKCFEKRHVIRCFGFIVAEIEMLLFENSINWFPNFQEFLFYFKSSFWNKFIFFFQFYISKMFRTSFFELSLFLFLISVVNSKRKKLFIDTE